MTVTITYHGHACFNVRTGDTDILIDPFLTGNAMADVTPDRVSPRYILVSHAHGDHLGDAVPIALRTGAEVISNAEIARYMKEQGVTSHAMHIGGARQFPFGKVKLTIAHHGSSFPDGRYGGAPCGFLLWLEDRVLYFAGDTALFLDMQLYGEEGIDVAMLPIGDNFTMGPADAVKAVRLLQPRTAILMHYNTFGVIAQDARAVAAAVRSQTQAEPAILAPGESMEVG
jgi:L-ascorbate metabolism protein UlaG (beta-lactamase superfamily)